MADNTDAGNRHYTRGMAGACTPSQIREAAGGHALSGLLDYVADFWYISLAKDRPAFFFRFSGSLPGMVSPDIRLPDDGVPRDDAP